MFKKHEIISVKSNYSCELLLFLPFLSRYNLLFAFTIKCRTCCKVDNFARLGFILPRSNNVLFIIFIVLLNFWYCNFLLFINVKLLFLIFYEFQTFNIKQILFIFFRPDPISKISALAFTNVGRTFLRSVQHRGSRLEENKIHMERWNQVPQK